MPNEKIPNRNNWRYSKDISKRFTVEDLTELYTTEILTWTQQMFSYSSLPLSIPKREIELILQTQGYAIITKVNGELYVFRGGLGGEPNPYYLPTIAVVANPALRFSKSLEIDKECVVIRNDSFYKGLLPIIEETAYLLAQCDISFKFATINIRVPALITAPNDTAKEEGEIFLRQIEDGKKLGVIGDSSFLEGIKVYDYARDGQSITHLIELKQYIWGTFLQRIGVQSQFNMKREALNQAETTLSADILYPRIDDMLEERKLGLEKVNAMFGTNITIEKSSVWYDEMLERDLTFEKTEAEISNLEADSTAKEANHSEDKGEEEKSENEQIE